MSLFSSYQKAPGPSAAVEVAATRIAGIALDRRGGQPAVVAYALEPLPAGAVVSSLTAGNIVDRPTVSGAMGRVLERLGRPRRIALVVPDPVAKVSLLRFEQVPARPEDLDDLIRWQIRKTAPFEIESAQVSYVAAQQTAEGQEFIVSLARRAVVEEYEQLAADAGAHAGLVDLATLNVINAVLASEPTAPGTDWLLVNVAPDYATLAILRGPHLIFFRNRAAETDGTLADLVHQTAMYYEDRLEGRGFSRVLLAGAGAGQAADVDLMRRSLQDRLATAVDTIDVRGAVVVTDRISTPTSFLDTLAPLAGVLLRGRPDRGEGGRAA
jgi:type IV pilus assembly protein PilM